MHSALKEGVVDKAVAKRKTKQEVAGTRDGYLSADERRAAGKALRDVAPRAAQGGWRPAKDRRDPIEILHESNKGRIPALVRIRFGRMAQSPFAFYRGSAAVMAAIWRRPRRPGFACRPAAPLI